MRGVTARLGKGAKPPLHPPFFDNHGLSLILECEILSCRSLCRIMSSGSNKRQRNKCKNIRFTDDEYAQIEDAAQRSGLTFSSYVRKQVLGTPGPRYVKSPPLHKQDLARLLGHVGKVGSNVNQIAHRVNCGEPVMHTTLLVIQHDIAGMRTAVLKALGYKPE